MKMSRSVLTLGIVITLLLWAAAVAAQQSAPSTPGPKLVVPPSPQQTQTPQSTATQPAPAKEVSMLAVVRDKKGQPVTSLGKQDFVLEQDGHAQAITQLSQPAELPLTIGVLADTGAEQRKALGDERKAGTDFLNRLLREGQDRGFVLHFDREVELLQDVTASRDKLAKAMDGISTEGNVSRPPSAGERHFSFGGEVLYDAIFLSADEVLKDDKGRKAIVLFSDGVDRSSKISLQRAIEAAQRANVLGVLRVRHSGGAGSGPQQSTLRSVGAAIQAAAIRRRRSRQRPGGGPNPGAGPVSGGRRPRGGRREPKSEPREKKAKERNPAADRRGDRRQQYLEFRRDGPNAAQIFAQIEQEMRHELQPGANARRDSAAVGFYKLRVSTRNRSDG